MPKRFTATEKWLDPWFCNLGERDRLFWIFLCDNCDYCGIWQVNKILVQTYFPGYEIDPLKFGDRVEALADEKWFIPKFLIFQYGRTLDGGLNKGDAAKSAVRRLLSLGLKDSVMRVIGGSIEGLGTPTATATAKDTVVDTDVKDVDVRDRVLGEGVPKKTIEEWFERMWLGYPKKGRVGKKAALRHYVAAVKTQEQAVEMGAALDNYLESDRVKNGFIQNASTWFNDWEAWKNDPGRNRTGVHGIANDARANNGDAGARGEAVLAGRTVQQLADSKRLPG